jgi:hypothetical protein
VSLWGVRQASEAEGGCCARRERAQGGLFEEGAAMIGRVSSRLGWGLAIFAIEFLVGVSEWLEARRARG